MRLIIISAFIQLAISQNLYAYLDPGTGSYVFQVLVAVIIGGLVAVKAFWHRIKNFLNSHFHK